MAKNNGKQQYSIEEQLGSALIKHVDYNVEKYRCERHPPVSTLPVDTISQGPIQFKLDGFADYLINTRDIHIDYLIKVQKKVGTEWVAIDDTDELTILMNTAYSMFQDVLVHVNGVLVDSDGQQHARQSYIRNLLWETEAYKDTVLSSGCWFMDKPGTLDLVSQTESTTPGGAKRAKMIKANQVINLRARVLSSLLQSAVPFSDKAVLGLSFIPARTELVIMQKKEPFIECRVQITDASLTVGRLSLKQKIPKTVKHTYFKHRVLTHTITKGLKDFSQQIVAGNNLPVYVMIGLTTEKCENGNYKLNPLKFYHANLSGVLLTLNGDHLPFLYGHNGLDFEKDHYSSAYLSMHDQLRTCSRVHYDDYDSGFTMLGFDIRKGNHGHTAQSGVLEVHIQFGSTPNENLKLIVYTITNESFYQDDFGNVVPDTKKLIL